MSEQRTLVNEPLVLHSDNGSPMKGDLPIGNALSAGDNSIQKSPKSEQ